MGTVRTGRGQLATATRAAVTACGGAGLGFLLDPLSCRYDPARDAAVLCAGARGDAGVVGRSSARACLTAPEARVVDKAWYGQTADGTAPASAADNGSANVLSGGKRLWFGWTRGTDLGASPAGGAPGLMLAADQTALELQNPALGSEAVPALGSTGFTNATGTGKNRWLDSLGYAGLAAAQAAGVRLQPQFSRINTDDPDLAGFAAARGGIVMYQGLADEYIPAQGAINYYERVMAGMGGSGAVQQSFRLYLIPGFTHSGRSEGRPSVPVPQPVPGRDELFVALQGWVENGRAPGTLQVQSGDARVTLPLCVYPLKLTYRGSGAVTSAASYACS